MDSSEASIRHSLVIPAYNEEAFLPRLLDSVDAARARYAGGAGAIEVIVADNASTDATARVAAERGCRVAPVEKRVIAAARNGGARLARGEILCFCDADMRMHPETFNVIDGALATRRLVGGATGVRMERMSAGIAVSYAMMIPLVWLTGMDTGVVFCRRADFESIGGYNEGRMWAEDVNLLFDLRRLGRARGQRLGRLTQAKAVCSARKFDKHGDWHYFRVLGVGLLGFVASPRWRSEFAQSYWYDDRKR